MDWIESTLFRVNEELRVAELLHQQAEDAAATAVGLRDVAKRRVADLERVKEALNDLMHPDRPEVPY